MRGLPVEDAVLHTENCVRDALWFGLTTNPLSLTVGLPASRRRPHGRPSGRVPEVSPRARDAAGQARDHDHNDGSGVVRRAGSSPVWAHKDAQSTKHVTAHLLRHLCPVPLALVRGKPHVTVFPDAEGLTGEGFCGTHVHALPTLSARLLSGPARRRERSVGQHRGPAHPRPGLRSDEEAALPNPSQPCQVRGHLVREEAVKTILIDPTRRGHSQRRGPSRL